MAASRNRRGRASAGLRSVLLAALVAAPWTLARAAPSRAEDVDRVVLRVNDEIATLFEYRDRKESRLEQLAQSPSVPDDKRAQLQAEAGRDTMREIFDDLLLVSRARQLHVEVSKAQVDAALGSTRKRFGLDTDADFRVALEQSGLTLERYRARLERSLLENEVVQREVDAKIKVDDEVAQRYYHDHAAEFLIPERVHVQEVVIRSDAVADAASRRALADKVRAAWRSDVALDQVLGAAGVDAASASAVDDGWVAKGELAPELEKIGWALAPGETSAPIAGRGGDHVLRLVERQAASEKPFADVKDDILAKQRARLYDEKMKDYLATLARSAYVVDHVPAEADGFRDTSPPKIEDALAPFAHPSESGKKPAAKPPAAKPATSEAPPRAATSEKPAASAPPPR